MKRYVQLLASLWHEAADTASCNRSCIDLADVRTATFEDLTDYPTCLAVRNHEYVAASLGVHFRCERRKPIVNSVLPCCVRASTTAGTALDSISIALDPVGPCENHYAFSDVAASVRVEHACNAQT